MGICVIFIVAKKEWCLAALSLCLETLETPCTNSTWLIFRVKFIYSGPSLTQRCLKIIDF